MRINGKIIFREDPSILILNKLSNSGISVKRMKDGSFRLDFEYKGYLKADTLAALQNFIREQESNILSADVEVVSEIWRYKK